ncbi:flagellar filament capping protein FliD [Chromobacterium haemolyticum]|uniref:flagellar filament capping protein FliD n=1 Tax=Chromobacterium haemolyticum TaxID=394935 RepID=UPI000DEEB90F|nr:flagellar filament capping protein FliD [Chromobacterium haemolyticum]
MAIDFSKTPPSALAQNAASLYLQDAQNQLDTQNKAAQARGDALNKLQKALQDYRSALSGITSKKSLVAMNASISQEGFGSVSAKGNAQPGNYSLFIEQVATAHQMSFGSLSSAKAQAGDKITIRQGSDSFEVDLSSADRDGDGNLSPSELALAINRASGNSGKVNAMVLNNGGTSQLVMSSGKTGESGAITLDLSQVSDAGLKTGLANPKELTKGQDAIVWLGNKDTGVQMKQASNTFESIDGVSLTISKAMKPGDTPLQLSVSRNDADTVSNVQGFVDSYNKLASAIADLSAPGKEGKAGGPFASDSGIRSLKDGINSLLRQPYDGITLNQLGIKANRDGSLSLDSKKLNETLKDKPDALDRFVNGDNKNGVVKQSSDYLDKWLNGSSGLLKLRKDSEARIQKDLDSRQTRLKAQYDQSYKRYLTQFTQLQKMQEDMQKTVDMLSF